MNKECVNCSYFFECDDKEEDPPDDICQNFYASNLDLDNGEWKEMSWRRFTDDLLDYGELSDWDEFVEEEE